MPFDSEGAFSRLHNWEDDRINDIDIMSDRHDEEDDNFAEGLSQCLLRSGQIAMTGNLNLGGFQVKNIADGQSPSDAISRRQLDNNISNNLSTIKEIINNIVPVGDIKASLQTANHGNWLLCDGQAVSRTEYSQLFALIGTNFGSGDGVSTFNLPDYRGKFLRGLGGDSAADLYTTQAEGLPNITGKAVGNRMTTGWTTINGAFASEQGPDVGPDWASGSGNGCFNFDASRSNSIYGASNHVTPINQAVNYFIRAKTEV